METQQQGSAKLGKSQFCEFTSGERRTDDFTLEYNLRTPRGKHERESSSPKVGLGALDIFPNEVLHCIIAQLDLRTVTNFHYVNRRARNLAASLPLYRCIRTHARNVLRCILGNSVGSRITLETLYQALCTAECASCGAFGGYLYLQTCTRICYPCFTKPQGSFQVMRSFTLTRPLLNTLPRMPSRAGTYSSRAKKYRAGLGLADGKSAWQAALAPHNSVATLEYCVREVAEQKSARWTSKSSASWPRRTGAPRDDKEGNQSRFMAVVRAPWLDRSSHRVEWGAYCKGRKSMLYGENSVYFPDESSLRLR
jgi:hypothetical protein